MPSSELSSELSSSEESSSEESSEESSESLEDADALDAEAVALTVADTLSLALALDPDDESMFCRPGS